MITCPIKGWRFQFDYIDTSLQTNMSTSTSNTHLHLIYMNNSALQWSLVLIRMSRHVCIELGKEKPLQSLIVNIFLNVFRALTHYPISEIISFI